MKNDRFLKIVFTIIAICLVIIVFKSFVPIEKVNAADARSTNKNSFETALELKEIKSMNVEDLKSIIPLDNQRTFVVVAKDKFTVYRLEYIDK